MANDAVVQLLYENIHALPHPEYGTIDMLPFAYDSDQTRMVKRQFSEAIIELLHTNGWLRDSTAPSEPVVNHAVSIRCHTCQNMLVDTMTDIAGNAAVNAQLFLGYLARLNPECPHKPVTPEDLRRHLEDEFRAAAEAEDEQSSEGEQDE